jgi:hypothetical protein
MEAMKELAGYTRRIPGVEVVHTSIRNYGNERSRLLFINRYGEPIDRESYLATHKEQAYIDATKRVFSAADDYKWFATEDFDIGSAFSPEQGTK